MQTTGATRQLLQHSGDAILANDPRTALCMGYLGYAYCDLRRFDEARSWTKLALERCPPTDNQWIYAKNLTNRGLVVYYADGDIDQAESLLEEAVELTSERNPAGADIREEGRASMYLAMVRLSRPGNSKAQLEESKALAERAKALTRNSGDIRRTAICDGLLGVAEARRHNYGLAHDHLGTAIRAHVNLRDYRNLSIELLNLSAVLSLEFGCTDNLTAEELLEHGRELERDNELKELMGQAKSDDRFSHFLEFWGSCIRPRLFWDI